jgi:hypothetical protein
MTPIVKPARESCRLIFQSSCADGSKCERQSRYTAASNALGLSDQA